MLIVVRHATPTVDPAVPPEAWELSAIGRADAASLVAALPADAVLVSSVEPKARQTLDPSGPVWTDRRFNEVSRIEAFGGDFPERRMDYVGDVDHDGWEPRAEVAARFADGIEEWLDRAGDRPLVVASHGMAITVWLTATIDIDDPAAFWQDLRFPDAWKVDVAARSIGRL